MNKTNNEDLPIKELIAEELERQKSTLNLIASENIAFPEVLKATGSVLMNKYSEGYPFKKYYGGNEFVNQIEYCAIERLKDLFGGEHGNVQPHSGSSANMAVFFALTNWLKDGNKILSMSLDQGGHLTHGSGVSFSGKLFDVQFYGVDKKTHTLDYDKIRKTALEFKPNILISGASAYPREVDFKSFGEIAREVGAFHVADIAHIAGLIAGGQHQNPTPYADVVTGTTQKTMRGPRGGFIVSRASLAKSIDKAVFPGIQGGPLENIIAAKAICFKLAIGDSFKKYQAQVVKNTRKLAETLMEEGMKVISEGTDNHLLLLDVSGFNLTGKQAEEILEKAGIAVNKNMIPYDERKPWDPSGLRIGTPAVTSRGMKEEEMEKIGKTISGLIKQKGEEQQIKEARKLSSQLCEKFPIYENLT